MFMGNSPDGLRSAIICTSISSSSICRFMRSNDAYSDVVFFGFYCYWYCDTYFPLFFSPFASLRISMSAPALYGMNLSYFCSIVVWSVSIFVVSPCIFLTYFCGVASIGIVFSAILSFPGCFLFSIHFFSLSCPRCLLVFHFLQCFACHVVLVVLFLGCYVGLAASVNMYSGICFTMSSYILWGESLC